MADFKTAYKITSKHEGGYANDPRDAGGETYRGIARNYFPKWPGWAIIEKYKLGGAIKWNTKFKNTELDNLVEDFYYKNFWVAQARGNEINNQEVANFIYDFCVNSGDAEDQIDKAINKAIQAATGQTVNTSNNRLDDASISLINQYPSKIYPYLLKERELYVRGLKSFKDFGKTWLNRIFSFPATIADYVADDPTGKKKES